MKKITVYLSVAMLAAASVAGCSGSSSNTDNSSASSSPSTSVSTSLEDRYASAMDSLAAVVAQEGTRLSQGSSTSWNESGFRTDFASCMVSKADSISDSDKKTVVAEIGALQKNHGTFDDLSTYAKKTEKIDQFKAAYDECGQKVFGTYSSKS
ncbi:MAG: hypothetical protein SPI12_04250 [Actinomycetaceae bacterium]|nr:hypothetical protein [Actinomycetaceae bacterium]MDY6083057.1 hypothetical protein [Actinomycetaceae bacterium]